MGRIGGDQQSPTACGRAGPRRAGGDRGLAHAPLAGIQDGARPHSARVYGQRRQGARPRGGVAKFAQTAMPHPNRRLRIGTLLALAATSLALAGCGGSSGDAVALIRQTFCGNHTITSGNLDVALTITPSGSRTLKGPLSLSLSGPFQSLGRGKLPKSDLTISLSGLGNSTSVGIISTGTHGYVTLSGASYQLPASSYRRLESSFSSFATPPGCS